MRRLGPASVADVYAVTCELGLTKIGVAADGRERCRAMQVGSPVPLQLGLCRRYAGAEDAYAVVADLQRQLADRRERGGWFRVSVTEVEAALHAGSARWAPLNAARARRAEAAEQARAQRRSALQADMDRADRARRRRQRLAAVARLFAEGLNQKQVAGELAVDVRTIRRWQRLPAFARELAKAQRPQERALERAERRKQTRAARVASPQPADREP